MRVLWSASRDRDMRQRPTQRGILFQLRALVEMDTQEGREEAVGYVSWVRLVLYLTIVGVVLTTIGASLIGWNDIMSEDKAIEVGVSRWAGTKEENRQLPAVQELLRRDKNSRRGLSFVVVGTMFLILASTL